MTVQFLRWTVPLFLGLACWLAKASIETQIEKYSRPSPVVTLETARFYSRSLRKFSLGFDNLLADLAWIQVVQAATHNRLLADGVSWEYAKLHSVITLDPKFERAYSFGASFLSIFRRDKEGAKDLLERWTKAEPLRWQSHYRYAFHLYHEMDDKPAASKQLLKAAALPRAPTWLTALGVRLLSASGSTFAALQTAVQLYPTVLGTEGQYRLQQRIRSLNYHLQKSALNDGIDLYRTKYRRDPAGLAEVAAVKTPIDYAELTRKIEAAEELLPLLQENFSFRYDPQTKRVEGVLAPSDQHLERLGIYEGKKS